MTELAEDETAPTTMLEEFITLRLLIGLALTDVIPSTFLRVMYYPRSPSVMREIFKADMYHNHRDRIDKLRNPQ